MEKRPLIIYKNIKTLEIEKSGFNDAWEFCCLFDSWDEWEKSKGENWKVIGLEIQGKDFVLRSELMPIGDLKDEQKVYVSIMFSALVKFKEMDIITKFQLGKMRTLIINQLDRKK